MDNRLQLQHKNPFNGKRISMKEVSRNTVKKMFLTAGLVLLLHSSFIFTVGEPYLKPLFSETTEMTEKQFTPVTILKQEQVYDSLKFLESHALAQIPTEEEQYIQFYSDIYGIDSNQVYQILSELTNDFEDEAYLKQYKIGKSMLKGKTIQCKSKEMAILIAVRSIYFSPEQYGKTYGELNTNIPYKSEQSYAQQIAYVSEVVGVDPALHYAICQSECGFNSSMFLNQHNPSGIKFGENYVTFPSTTAGFIEQALELLKYQNMGITSIEGIGAYHAPNEHNENPDWIPNVTSIYGQVNLQRETMFIVEEPKKILKIGQRLGK